MDDFFEQYSWMIVEFISGLLSLSLMFSMFSSQDIIQSVGIEHMDHSSKVAQVHYDLPIVDQNNFIVDSAIIDQYSLFNWKDYVHYSNEQYDLINYISVTMNVGEYTLTFTLYFNGEMIEKKAKYYVREV